MLPMIASKKNYRISAVYIYHSNGYIDINMQGVHQGLGGVKRHTSGVADCSAAFFFTQNSMMKTPQKP